MAAVNVASNGWRGWGISVDQVVRRLVRRWVDASIGRVGKRAVRSAVCSVRAAAAGGGSRWEARTRVYCRARVMWRRAVVASVSVGAVTRVVFSFFQGLGKQTGWNCD